VDQMAELQRAWSTPQQISIKTCCLAQAAILLGIARQSLRLRIRDLGCTSRTPLKPTKTIGRRFPERQGVGPPSRTCSDRIPKR
jgi:hypothetical protein